MSDNQLEALNDTIRKKKEAEKKKKERRSKRLKRIFIYFSIVFIIGAAGGVFGIVYNNGIKSANKTIELIDVLPDTVIDYEYYDELIKDAHESYLSLKNWQKEKVENRDKLLSIMPRYNEYKVNKLREEVQKVTAETVGTTTILKDVISMYNALSEDQKALLSNEERFAIDNYIKADRVVDRLFYIKESINERYVELEQTEADYNTIDVSYNWLVYNDNLFEYIEEQYALSEYTSISNINELEALANQNGRYKLVNDIDLSIVENWEPIENFSGELHGNGYSIKNLTINAANKENVGLFAYLKGTVSNLKITNANVTVQGDKNHVAILAGSCSGTVDNVQVSGSVVATYANYVGGIVGDMNQGGRINNCINYASVIGNQHVGGVFGEIDANIDNAVDGNINEGSIVGNENVGGIGGYLQNIAWEKSNNTHVVSNNINNGAVKGKANVGGIFGKVYGAHYDSPSSSKYDGYGYFEMTLLKNNAKITCSGNDVGGIIGYGTRVNKITLSENYGDITGVAAVGGFVGYSPSTYINASGFINTAVITGGNRIGSFAGEAGVIENAINSGSIVFVSSTATEANVGGIAGYCQGLINCVNNCDITVENGLNYVGGLAGYITTYDTNKVNDNVNNGKVTAETSGNVGGIAGHLNNTAWEKSNNIHIASNNVNNGEVKGKTNVGGIFGKVYGAHYDSPSSSKYDGYGYFEMTLLKNNAKIIGSDENIGGLIGFGTRVNKITLSENYADIAGINCVGGFVGYSPSTYINASKFENKNTITGSRKVGAFAGEVGVVEDAINSGKIVFVISTHTDAILGGIVGYCNGLINCMNNSDISVIHGKNYVGGLAGYITTYDTNKVNGNVNNGKVTAETSEDVGGIAGYLSNTAWEKSDNIHIVSNNINNGEVKGKTNVGGIFGRIYGAHYDSPSSSKYDGYGYFEVVNSTNNAEIFGENYVGGIVGYYTRLKTEENYMNTNTTLYGEKLGH